MREQLLNHCSNKSDNCLQEKPHKPAPGERQGNLLAEEKKVKSVPHTNTVKTSC